MSGSFLNLFCSSFERRSAAQLTTHNRCVVVFYQVFSHIIPSETGQLSRPLQLSIPTAVSNTPAISLDLIQKICSQSFAVFVANYRRLQQKITVSLHVFPITNISRANNQATAINSKSRGQGPYSTRSIRFRVEHYPILLLATNLPGACLYSNQPYHLLHAC